MAQSNQTVASQEFSNVMPVWKFCFLYVITFSFYQLPWVHKHWKFLKDRENLNINPWFRSLCAPFYLYSLCKKVFVLADRQGYRERPSAFQVTFFFWVFVVLIFLPDPFWLITLFSFVPLLTLLRAANYYWEQEQPNLPKRESFTGREILWIVIGIVFWLLGIIGLLVELGVISEPPVS